MAGTLRKSRSTIGVARALAVLTVVGATALLSGAERASSGAIGPCGASPIVCENQLPGTPKAQWDVQGSGDATIQGTARRAQIGRVAAASQAWVATSSCGESVSRTRL